jgi:hypothetical protein
MASAEQRLQQAVEAIKKGQYDAGATMLKLALSNSNLSRAHRAIAYAWLAHTRKELSFKIQCLNRAKEYDPNNPVIQQHLNYYLSHQSRQTPYPTQRPKPEPPKPAAKKVSPDAISVIMPTADLSNSQKMRSIGVDDTPKANVIQNNQERQQIITDFHPPKQTGDTGPMPNLGRHAPSQQPTPYRLQQMSQIVGITGGSNGSGSGVFVTTDGLIATSRHVVGGCREVTIRVDDTHQTTGQVIRSYPELDLAFIHTNVKLDRVWPAIKTPINMDAPLVSMNFQQHITNWKYRQSTEQHKAQWIATSLHITQVQDAGGDAIYDDQQYLVGIITRNASRETGYVYGLHIAAIYEKVLEYLSERKDMPNAVYCSSCGNLSQAPAHGGGYCETCGAQHPNMESSRPVSYTSSKLKYIYNENLFRACPNCQSRSGYHNSKCLRCGYDIEKQLSKRKLT